MKLNAKLMIAILQILAVLQVGLAYSDYKESYGDLEGDCSLLLRKRRMTVYRTVDELEKALKLAAVPSLDSVFKQVVLEYQSMQKEFLSSAKDGIKCELVEEFLPKLENVEKRFGELLSRLEMV